MTTEELAQVWVPVPLRWRHVAAGDVFLGRESQLWRVERVGSSYGPGVEVTVSTVDATFSDEVDPDDVIEVLIPTLEVDAVELTREELGARLVARRTKDEG
jgi:hypothetical protein